MNLAQMVAGGFLLGLSTGPVCLLSCVPVLIPFTLASGVDARARWRFVGTFLAGRFLAYATIGLLAGAAARQMGFTGHRLALWSWLALALLLVAWGLGARPELGGLCKLAWRVSSRRSFSFALGLLTGAGVCPPLLLAVSFAADRAVGPLTGLAVFAAFFAATSLYVLPVGVLGHLPRRRVLDLAGRGVAVIAGSAFFWQAVLLLRAGH